MSDDDENLEQYWCAACETNPAQLEHDLAVARAEIERLKAALTAGWFASRAEKAVLDAVARIRLERRADGLVHAVEPREAVPHAYALFELELARRGSS